MVIREYGLVQLQDGRGRAAGHFRQQQAIFVEKLAQRLGNGKDPLPVRDVFQNIFFDPCAPDQRPLLAAGGAEKAGLAGENHKKIMAAVRAAHPGKTVLHDPAVEVFADGGGDDFSEITILLFIPLRIDFFIFFKMLVGDSISCSGSFSTNSLDHVQKLLRDEAFEFAERLFLKNRSYLFFFVRGTFAEN